MNEKMAVLMEKIQGVADTMVDTINFVNEEDEVDIEVRVIVKIMREATLRYCQKMNDMFEVIIPKLLEIDQEEEELVSSPLFSFSRMEHTL